MASVPVWFYLEHTEEWHQFQVELTGESEYPLFSRIRECKEALKRGRSELRSVATSSIQCRVVGVSEKVPLIHQLNSAEKGDDWIVNDRSAVHVSVDWGYAGGSVRSCDFVSRDEDMHQDHPGNDGGGGGNCGASVCSFTSDFAEGYDAAWGKAWKMAKEEFGSRPDGITAKGYEVGITTGFSKGYQSGHDTGYQKGHAEGYQKGHAEGHSAGYQTGDAEGYQKGLGDAKMQLDIQKAPQPVAEVAPRAEEPPSHSSEGSWTKEAGRDQISPFAGMTERKTLTLTVPPQRVGGFESS